MKKYIKHIIILIIFIVLLLVKSNYLYFSDEYYINDLIYTKNDNKPLNGYIYCDKFGYTTSYISVIDGYIVGDYTLVVEGAEYKHDFYITDTLILNKVKKIVMHDKISLYFEKVLGKIYINIRILNKDMFLYNPKYLVEHKIMAEKLYKLFKNEKFIENIIVNIEFIYVDKLYLSNEKGITRFSFKADSIEYCIHNYKEYKIIGDSAVYVP